MDMSLLRGLVTAITFIAFVALCIIVYLPRNAEAIEKNALLPFLEDEQQENLSE